MQGVRALVAGAVVFVAAVGLQARQASSPTTCRTTGHVVGAGTPLPGVAVTATRDAMVQATTSTGVDGNFTIALPSGDYRLAFELTGFQRVERDVTIAPPQCATEKIDVALSLVPRTPRPATAPQASRAAGFQTLALQQQQAAATEPTNDDAGAAAALLLPPGFAAEASANAIAVNGADARVDRGQLNDRGAALGRGDFGLGDIPPELLAAAGAFGAGNGGPPFAQGGPGGPGGPGGFPGGGLGGGRQGGGRGGGGGRGNFALGGRAGRQNRITGTVDYGFGGSALDSAPYQLRSDVASTERPYTRQSFGTTLGGPLKIPGIYDGTQKTSFTLNYTGTRGANVFDQYATVPTAAMRAGDLSSLGGQLINPATGSAFQNNQIPADAISPQARSLLGLIPLPNLSGTTRNYHLSSTTSSTNDNLNVRITHNFTPNAGPAGRFGGRGGGGFGGGRAGGRGNQTPAGRGLNVSLNAQVQYRRSQNDQLNVFSALGGHSSSTTFATPVSLNVVNRRGLHAITAQFSHTASTTTNNFTGVQNVAGAAGILGVSSDPFAWSAPTLSFSSITGLRDVSPASRSDRRFSTGYTFTHPVRRHVLRFGGDFRWDTSTSHTEPNAAGTFVFTGLYAGGGSVIPGADFADFLLGLPQQASVQYGPGTVTLKGKSTSLFAQDDWRWKSNVTFNLGVRYELLWPFVEASDHLVNLDVTPNFTAAVPVIADQTGPFSGQFPAALLKTDTNNIAPRLGVAWRVRQGLVVRGGYGISYNSGTYAAIARQLATQPPFATASTEIGSLNRILLLENALSGASADLTTNTYGVDENYGLGRVQTWNVDVQKTLQQVWTAGAGYTYTRGSSLDIVRAPNRGPLGLRIPGVDPFIWQSSEGESRLQSGTFRLQRRQVRGLGFGVTYTLARSRDNAPSIGGGTGASVVAQNDQDVSSEWGLSNFDRRHRVTVAAQYELPFGPNKRWLANGGMRAALFQGWRMTATLEVDSGTPLTPRVQSSARDAAQGINGALRADYNGAPISLESPTVDRFFNTSAFSIPTTGLFGSSPRNLIIGPGSRELDAQFSRDIPLRGTRVLTIDVRATNLLNNVNYAAIDTSVNSPTFGEVLSVRPMRSAQLNARFRF